MRLRIAAASVGVLALALSACSQGSATAPSPSADGKTVVRYMNFSANNGHEKDLDAIVAAFQKANAGIEVQVETVPYANYFTKLQTAVAGGTAPDAFELNYENFVTYAKNGSLAELSGVDKSAYRKSLVEAYASDGKQYGLPESFSNVVLFYNKKLFSDAGVAAPAATWTWADEQAAAQKLSNKAAGVWGDYQPMTYNEFYKALAQTGGKFLSDDGKRATFDSPEGLRAANWLIGKNGKTMPTEADGAGTPDFDSKLFKDGKLAMWHNGIWNFSTLKDVSFDWDVVVEPGDTTKASAMFVNGLTVSSASKNKDAAQKWISYLSASDTTAKVRLDSSWELPPVADQSKLASYLSQPKPANRKAVFDALENSVLPPVIKRQQEMQDAVTKELGEAAAGRKPVAQALKDAQTAVNGMLG
ncbi:ABC transporter substrate-binding protein [Actinocrispum wychmicini]|uniref:Multiple sugar transport system substrate-binding protein n=1 Tax=Actinocrispum wychmicini TaxID=1213861 RepID=A0A4R2JGM1_9PSEU|nr:sugar ABC transporter substrate-binding protein [Actinocrispum wychmicini]TCO56048.1 multiple sugar transport system substrate-binding protein [Actinocrispum wychmicini]